MKEDELEGWVCGMVGLEYKSDQEAELRRMFVDPRCRSRGVGKLLIDTALSHARSEGFRKDISRYTNNE